MSLPDRKTIIQMLRTLQASPEIVTDEAKLYCMYAADALEEEQRIMQSLPQTADGVPAVPGMQIWHQHSIQKNIFYPKTICGTRVALNGIFISREANEFYSTEEAARKAAARAGG